MIKRYTAASGTATANESWVTRPISINRRSICLAEDVSALEKKVCDLETENAELRERVVELEEWQRKAISHFNCLNGIHPHNICGVLQQWSDIFDFINAIKSSPLNVEKGEEG